VRNRKVLLKIGATALATLTLACGCGSSAETEAVDTVTDVETVMEDIPTAAPTAGATVESGVFYAAMDQGEESTMPGTGLPNGEVLFRATISGNTVTTTPILCEGVLPPLDLAATLNAEHTSLTWPDDATPVPFSVRDDGLAFALSTQLSDGTNPDFTEASQPEAVSLLDEFRTNCRDFYGESWTDPTESDNAAGSFTDGQFVWVGPDSVDLLTISGDAADYQVVECTGVNDEYSISGTFNEDHSAITFGDYEPSIFAASASGDVVSLDYGWMYRLGTLGAGNALGPWMEACTASEGDTWAMPEVLLGRTQNE